MIRPNIEYRSFLFYLFKFIFAYCVLYYGTLAIIGFSTPEGYHSNFVEKYLDYIEWLRSVLLRGSKLFLSLLGYKSNIDTTSVHIIRLTGGRGVRIVYSCIGYGVMSFWGAFVYANKGKWTKKIKWIIGGWIAICFINIGRISLLLISINKGWAMPFNLDHHTLFNIAAYTLVFFMIYLFDRSGKKKNTIDTNEADLKSRLVE